jgi:Fe-S oxidoreductase
MALENYEQDMMRCNRCSYCKWVPHEVMKDTRFLGICPSVEKYNFHSRSASGRLITALSLLKERIDLNDASRDTIYQCQMCGGCDVSCKVERDLEPYEIMQELRFRCVEKGVIPPEHLKMVDSLKREANAMGKPKADRGNWADGLGVKYLGKEEADVLFHAGCQYSFDESLWPTARSGLNLLLNAGVDVGIMGKSEVCCGGRGYEMGFKDVLTQFAKRNTKFWKTAGVRTVVTPCADCYQSFKVLYDKIGKKEDVEILHITQFIHRLIKEGKIKLTKEVPLNVTYHDPCHLGRLADPWIHWEGEEKRVFGQMIVHDPPKEKRFGLNGVYDVPREILKAIPGLKLTEMHRIREYAWCCGSGSGVKEAYPDFAESTAAKRIEEARSVGAEALVSSCPWCKSNFEDCATETGDSIQVYDILDLVQQAI